MRLHFLCEKFGAIALDLPDLTAGWPAGKQADRQDGWQADEIVLIFLKLYTG